MPDGRFARIKTDAGNRWRRLKERHRWLATVVAAWRLMQRNYGNQFAGAITYFSFLALFPMLLLAVSVAGFVLHAHPAAEQSFFNHVSAKVPGQFGNELKKALQSAIDNRSGVGVVGLAGVLLTGLGWIGNLRAAIDAVWGESPARVNFVVAKVRNLVVLAGLGLGIVVSLGLTVAGTALTDQILRALSLEHVSGAHVLVKVLGIALALLGDLLIYWWLLVRLPQAEVPPAIGLRGAVIAAVGFEVLKVVGTYTIAATSHSPTAGPFAGIIAILVWIQLVARLMLFACAWTAVRTRQESPPPAVEPEVVVVAEEEPRAGFGPAAVGATLVGAGMLAGAVLSRRAGHGRRAASRSAGSA